MRCARSLPFALSILAAVQAPAQAPQPSDPRQRVRTARELGKQGSEAIPKLQPMLSDPSTEVRVEAVKAIVDIGTRASLDPLIQATRDNDPEVQIRATDGLVNYYVPGYVRTGLTASLRRAGDAIKSRFTDTNDVVVEPFVDVRPEVITALSALVRGGNGMDSRANAARAVGILRGRAALPDLYEGLHSKDDQLIYESLVAIRKIGDQDAGPRVTFLLRDPVEMVQLAAIETTGLLRNREAIGDLRGVMANPPNAKVRRAALTAIAMMPDASSRPDYLRYLAGMDDGMRTAAAEGLGRLKNPADMAALQKALQEERKMQPRLALAFAVVMMGHHELSELSPLQYLINTLNSTMWRGVARAYLIELARDPAVLRALQYSTSRGTKDEKIELSMILARSGNKDTLPCLDTLTRDGDTDVASAAINASRTLKARLP